MLDDDNMEQDDDLDENTPETPASPAPPKEEKQKSSISADLIRGHINTIILRTLSERDKYGYEIIEEIQRKSHGQYELKQPTLYSALKRLENQGYIKAYWKTDEISAGGRRKYYTLTESGREITEKNRAEWEYSRTVIDNLISDQEYDLSKPAPSPVDFKILKQSTSRVPTVKLEETKQSDNQAVIEASFAEDDETTAVPEEHIAAETTEVKQSAVENSGEAVVTPPVYPDTDEIYEIEKPAVGSAEEAIEPPPVYPASEKASVRESEVYDSGGEPEHTENVDAYNTDYTAEQIYTSGVREQQASYFRAESIEEAYGDQYDKYEQPEPVSQPEPVIRRGGERLPTESDEYKKQHENYLKLIDDRYVGNGQRKSEPEYGEKLDTDKLIYINKPETERDYKNLVNDMFSQTIKPQRPVNDPEPEPDLYIQAVPPPVAEQEPAAPAYYTVQSEESRQAESDGLKIFTSDRQPKPTGKYIRNYNLGLTLFKSAAVTFAYMMIIFIIIISCKSSLGVSLVYPFVIFGIACGLFAVCAVLALCGFGRNSVKPVSHNYIGACAVLTVIAILIVCVSSILLNIDFSSAADVCKKMVIPSVTLLAVPLYSVMFYVFSK